MTSEKIHPSSMLCRMTYWTTFVPELILECAHTGRYDFLKIFTKKALCWIWSLNFKKFWSPNGNDSGVGPTTKVVQHVHLHNILKEQIFSTSFTRKPSTDRKVRNRDAKNAHFRRSWYSKNYLLMHDTLEINICRIKEESFNLVHK